MLQASSDNPVAKDEDLHGHVDKKISGASHVAKEIQMTFPGITSSGNMLQASSDNHVEKDKDLHGHVDKKISGASHVAKEILMTFPGITSCLDWFGFNCLGLVVQIVIVQIGLFSSFNKLSIILARVSNKG